MKSVNSGDRPLKDYVQVTAYIRSKVYEEAKINFNNREFSGLVEELLLDWNWKQEDRR